MRHEESDLQRNCVTWFNLQYPQYRGLLFAVPNGGARGRVTAAIMKGEGVVAGVADLILLVPRAGHNALCIEMKTPKGRQSPAQRAWQKAAEAQGCRYAVCRSAEEFARETAMYLTERENAGGGRPPATEIKDNSL